MNVACYSKFVKGDKLVDTYKLFTAVSVESAIQKAIQIALGDEILLLFQGEHEAIEVGIEEQCAFWKNYWYLSSFTVDELHEYHRKKATNQILKNKKSEEKKNGK